MEKILAQQVADRHIIGHGCISLDITLNDLAYGWRSLVTAPSNPRDSISQIEAAWNSRDIQNHDKETVFVGLSCRTILDLWLTVKAFPAGSQVLIGAINIPDISVVLRHHKLVPVPIDVDVDTFEPDMDLMHSHKNSRTVAVLLAHIYGRHINMQPYIEFCRRHNLQLIEDLAEGFAGMQYTGSLMADLSFVSFGTIKTNTSLGGGVARVRCAATRKEMHLRNEKYPRTSRVAFGKKLLKTLPLVPILKSPFFARCMLGLCYMVGFNHKEAIVTLVRGFSKDKLIQAIRAQPSLPLLALIQRRLNNFDDKRFNTWTRNVITITNRLDAEQKRCNYPFKIPGLKCQNVRFWLYPVLVPDPSQCEKALNSCGIDATVASTQLNVVPLPHPDELLPAQMVPLVPFAQAYMKHVLYLPVHAGPSVKELDRIASTFLSVMNLTSRIVPDSMEILFNDSSKPRVYRSKL